jgi:nucleoside-diphosphate-sugar epimerase
MRLDLLVNQFVYEAIKNGVLNVYGRNYVRSIIHVSDMARSILFAIYHSAAMKGQVFNVSSNESHTKEQIAQNVGKMVGCHLCLTDSDADLRNYQLSTEKISALGYRTRVSLEEGILELVRALYNLQPASTCFNRGVLA